MINAETNKNQSYGFSISYFLARYWILAFLIVGGLYITLPFLAPIFMQLGLTKPASIIYLIYSTQCHQLPERSYFLFGHQIMYTLPQIQAVWKNTNNPWILRQFIGNAQMGWKVAWSDRMVSMYTSTVFFGLIWWPLRKKIRPLSFLGLALFLLPMAIDGGTHFLSDFAGLGNGFRDSNAWLVMLTHNAFPSWFYAGDAWGSFNSIMRIITGILFGIGVVWFGFPYVDDSFHSVIEREEIKQSL